MSGEDRAAGTTWGDYEVSGRYDGRAFEVLRAGPPSRAEPRSDPIETACPEPEGGWRATDPGLTSENDRNDAIDFARSQPDYSGAWIDHIGQPTEFEEDDYILNVAFTGDVAAHERALRNHWGGPLCLTRHPHTLERLKEIQAELTGGVGNRLGLDVLSANSREDRNVVEISVVVIDQATERAIARRYGEGTVEVTPALVPID